ncbi:uncharacterized protein C4orf45-like [Actinia tenebrosa]|uniref:Uncharacterized protein C4orf45-like n=1 Tax=Actinia tenebrosa TaxID=6105 RepID=A0A6P8I6D9_ACTTE|nr:uncharacterized protein C4orf45-like [Actinia tenebrosa]
MAQLDMADTTRIRIHSIPGSDRFYNPHIGKGKVVFTGPDAISNQRVTRLQPTYVGIGTMSPEGTSDAEYLWRPGRRWAFPAPKSASVGAIGWGLNLFHDIKRLKSGQQIMRGEFRQECEDRHTHLYQNPWYPDMRDQQEEGPAVNNTYDRHSIYSRPGTSHQHSPVLRSSTPTPRVHYENRDRHLPLRPRSCTPSTQRSRSGTVSSSTSHYSQQYTY